MAAWRLHLSDQTVRRLDILPGKPSVLAAWTGPRRVFFFDLSHATRLGERAYDGILPSARTGEPWQTFVNGFRAPNDAALPMVRAAGLTLYTSTDGATRLLHDDETGDLLLNTGDQHVRLHRDASVSFVTVAYDRGTGLIAALDEGGRLHTYKRDLRLAIVDLKLAVEDWRPMLVLPQTGNTIICGNGESVVVTDPSGQLRKRLPLHYRLGPMTCSPDGKNLALTDADIGVIRIYDGDLQPTHQRFAADLLADARRVQLIGGTGGASSMLTALALNNRGVLAFAVAGIVCVSSMNRMSVLPRD
jgi:hypothetical protein